MLVDLINEQIKSEDVELIIINDSFCKNLIHNISKDVTIHLINRIPNSRNILKVLRLNYLIIKINPNVIHVHNQEAIKLILVNGKARVVLTVHTVNESLSNLKKYKKIFSISESVKLNISNRGGVESIRIYNGIDFAAVKLKRTYDKTKIIKLVQVGRLDHEIKGQHLLLEAIYQLVHKFGLSNLHLDFIGEGASLSYLKEMASTYNLNSFVTFLGIRDRKFIYSNLQFYDVLVQPSIKEGFGLSIVEGIAAGLPVIVSDIDGPAEIISMIPYGWLFRNNQSSTLAGCIKEVFEQYESGEIERKCKQNYSTAISSFSIQNTAQNYIANYV